MFKQNIAKGATYLDKVVPGWEQKINLEHFSVANCKNCVLGQVFGNYFDAVNELHLDSTTANHYGFWTEFNWRILNKEWQEYLKARRNHV